MFKALGPLWAHAPGGGENVFARLVKTGKKVLRRVLEKEREPVPVAEILKRPTWRLQAQTVQVGESSRGRLIGGLFPKHILKTQASEVRLQEALRFIRNAKKVPVFAFVALSLGLETADRKSEGREDLFSGIQDLFQQHGVKESGMMESTPRFSLETLQLGKLIGQGCNAAVLEAKLAQPVCEQESHSDEVEPDTWTKQEAGSCSEAVSLSSDHIPSTMEGSCVDSPVETPPAIFHTDDYSAVFDESDDDISIISEEDEESEDKETVDPDGWVMYRVSSSRDKAAAADPSDADSDIFILASDDRELESLPDLEEWLMTGAGLLDVCTSQASQTSMESTDTDRSSTDISSLSTSSTGSLASTVSTASEPEPAPNITGFEEYPLAVKMMYNYNVESRADKILSAMDKEAVLLLPSSSVTSGDSVHTGKKLAPHPNLVAMHGVFVDQVPDLPEGEHVFPSALPARLNKEGGFGRNATMFLVMHRYNMTLNEYLASHDVDVHTRCLLLAQLLEGVAHLNKHGVAHRDLKSNNILVDLSRGTDHPWLAICDFGCCLWDDNYGLKIPFLSGEMNKGGNSALMAPEIKCATPGPCSFLDYSKADLWAAGALAHEIFGHGNPFYGQLDARDYRDDNLPSLAGDTPDGVKKLVDLMLRRDPCERPTAAVAATVMQFLLWAPPQLQPFNTTHQGANSAVWRFRELCCWLERLTLETVCQRAFGGKGSPLHLSLKASFLSRLSQPDVWAAVAFEGYGC